VKFMSESVIDLGVTAKSLPGHRSGRVFKLKFDPAAIGAACAGHKPGSRAHLGVHRRGDAEADAATETCSNPAEMRIDTFPCVGCWRQHATNRFGDPHHPFAHRPRR